jgi:hypothetical protein
MTMPVTPEIQNYLDRAQQVINAHLRSNAGGRCETCGELEPCEARSLAESAFRIYHRLPRRTPGTAIPWFDRAQH